MQHSLNGINGDPPDSAHSSSPLPPPPQWPHPEPEEAEESFQSAVEHLSHTSRTPTPPLRSTCSRPSIDHHALLAHIASEKASLQETLNHTMSLHEEAEVFPALRFRIGMTAEGIRNLMLELEQWRVQLVVEKRRSLEVERRERRSGGVGSRRRVRFLEMVEVEDGVVKRERESVESENEMAVEMDNITAEGAVRAGCDLDAGKWTEKMNIKEENESEREINATQANSAGPFDNSSQGIYRPGQPLRPLTSSEYLQIKLETNLDANTSSSFDDSFTSPFDSHIQDQSRQEMDPNIKDRLRSNGKDCFEGTSDKVKAEIDDGFDHAARANKENHPIETSPGFMWHVNSEPRRRAKRSFDDAFSSDEVLPARVYIKEEGAISDITKQYGTGFEPISTTPPQTRAHIKTESPTQDASKNQELHGAELPHASFPVPSSSPFTYTPRGRRTHRFDETLSSPFDYHIDETTNLLVDDTDEVNIRDGNTSTPVQAQACVKIESTMHLHSETDQTDQELGYSDNSQACVTTRVEQTFSSAFDSHVDSTANQLRNEVAEASIEDGNTSTPVQTQAYAQTESIMHLNSESDQPDQQLGNSENSQARFSTSFNETFESNIDETANLFVREDGGIRLEAKTEDEPTTAMDSDVKGVGNARGAEASFSELWWSF